MYAPKTPFARTMMVPLLVHVIMDILVMESTRATNWTIWLFTTRTLKNGRVPMAITDRRFLAKMIMNAFSILVQPTQNVPILSVLSNVNAMTDTPVMGSIARISMNATVPLVTMLAASTLMVHSTVIVIPDILVMVSTAKNSTKEPNSIQSVASGHAQ